MLYQNPCTAPGLSSTEPSHVGPEPTSGRGEGLRPRGGVGSHKWANVGPHLVGGGLTPEPSQLKSILIWAVVKSTYLSLSVPHLPHVGL